MGTGYVPGLSEFHRQVATRVTIAVLAMKDHLSFPGPINRSAIIAPQAYSPPKTAAMRIKYIRLDSILEPNMFWLINSVINAVVASFVYVAEISLINIIIASKIRT